jgi:hypothetical protein
MDRENDAHRNLMGLHLNTDVAHDFGGPFAATAANRFWIQHGLNRLPSEHAAREFFFQNPDNLLGDQWQARVDNRVQFTLFEETDGYQNNSANPVRLNPAGNQGIGIVQDAGKFITLDLGCKNVITFGSIIDPAPKPVAPDHRGLWFDAGPAAVHTTNATDYGFDPVKLNRYHIRNLRSGLVSCAFEADGPHRYYDAVQAREIGAVAEATGSKGINARGGGFLASIAEAEAAQGAGADAIYYSIGKSSGDILLVDSVRMDIDNPFRGVPLTNGQWKTFVGGNVPDALPTALGLKTHDELEFVRAVIFGVKYSIFEEVATKAKPFRRYLAIPGDVSDENYIESLRTDLRDARTVEVRRAYDILIADLSRGIVNGRIADTHRNFTGTSAGDGSDQWHAAGVAMYTAIIARLTALRDVVMQRYVQVANDLPNDRVAAYQLHTAEVNALKARIPSKPLITLRRLVNDPIPIYFDPANKINVTLRLFAATKRGFGTPEESLGDLSKFFDPIARVLPAPAAPAVPIEVEAPAAPAAPIEVEAAPAAPAAPIEVEAAPAAPADVLHGHLRNLITALARFRDTQTPETVAAYQTAVEVVRNDPYFRRFSDGEVVLRTITTPISGLIDLTFAFTISPERRVIMFNAAIQTVRRMIAVVTDGQRGGQHGGMDTDAAEDDDRSLVEALLQLQLTPPPEAPTAPRYTFAEFSEEAVALLPWSWNDFRRMTRRELTEDDPSDDTLWKTALSFILHNPAAFESIDSIVMRDLLNDLQTVGVTLVESNEPHTPADERIALACFHAFVAHREWQNARMCGHDEADTDVEWNSCATTFAALRDMFLASAGTNGGPPVANANQGSPVANTNQGLVTPEKKEAPPLTFGSDVTASQSSVYPAPDQGSESDSSDGKLGSPGFLKRASDVRAGINDVDVGAAAAAKELLQKDYARDVLGQLLTAKNNPDTPDNPRFLALLEAAIAQIGPPTAQDMNLLGEYLVSPAAAAAARDANLEAAYAAYTAALGAEAPTDEVVKTVFNGLSVDHRATLLIWATRNEMGGGFRLGPRPKWL